MPLGTGTRQGRRFSHWFLGESLRMRASRTAGWTIFEFGMTAIIRLVSSSVLTRLLLPEMFALMGLAQLFVSGIQMLTDVGIQVGVIQSRREDPTYLNTAWTIQVVRGCLLFVLTIAAAWPYSLLYDQPTLMWVLPLCGLSIAIMGCKSMSMTMAMRDMRRGKLTIMMVSTRMLGVIVTMVWAWISPEIWAIVAGGLVSSILMILLSHTMLPGPCHRLMFDRVAARDLARVGRWVVLATGLTFLANQSDRLILGTLLDMNSLGVLMIAYGLYQMPREILMAVIGNVLLPAARQRADLPRNELRKKVLKSRWPFLCVTAVFVAIVAGLGDIIVMVIYDERYREAMWMLPLLILGLWARVLDASIHEVLIAIRKLHYNPAGSAARLLLVILALPFAFHHFGLPGAVIVIAAADVPNYLACLYGQWRCGLLAIRQDIGASAVLAFALGIVLLIRWQLALGSPIDTVF
jgi:O-antigen/teichoic acid export membrane protein